MVFIKHNSLKSDIFLIPYLFHVFQDPCFQGSRFFRVQVFESPGFPGSGFFRFQGFQGQVFSWPGSRFFRVWVQVLEVAFIFFIFGHHVKSYGLIPMISVPHLSRNKLEDVTNLSNMIFFCQL